MTGSISKSTAIFIWGKWLPYHFARVSACADYFSNRNMNVLGVQYSSVSTDYAIESQNQRLDFDFITPRLGNHETDFRLLRILRVWPNIIKDYKVKVVFVPSYWDWSYTISILSKVMGCQVIMMNESHAGTEKANVFKKMVKKIMLKLFDSALVGGSPHLRHFNNLGISKSRIFTGYDAIDNNLFSSISKSIKTLPVCLKTTYVAYQYTDPMHRFKPVVSQAQLRTIYGLPDSYYLSLGRMVEKKNLCQLICAYAAYLDCYSSSSFQHLASAKLLDFNYDCIDIALNPKSLVIVGSGETQSLLYKMASDFNINIIDRSTWPIQDHSSSFLHDEIYSQDTVRSTTNYDKFATSRSKLNFNEREIPAIYFYGFRQIQDNPVFYSLAKAFILPSLWEEWGLVVNEAMACSSPVLVSRTAGCSDDLVPKLIDMRYKHLIDLYAYDKTYGGLEGQRLNGFVFDPYSSKSMTNSLCSFDICDLLPNQHPCSSHSMGEISSKIVDHYSCKNFAINAYAAQQ